MFGATSPTKAISPVKEITIEVIKAERIKVSFLILTGSTPVEIAKSSPPNANEFKSQAFFKAEGKSPIKATEIQSVFTRVGLDKLPKDQWANCDSCISVAKYCIIETNAPAINVTAIPTRMYDSAETDLKLPS